MIDYQLNNIQQHELIVQLLHPFFVEFLYQEKHLVLLQLLFDFVFELNIHVHLNKQYFHVYLQESILNPAIYFLKNYNSLEQT